MLCYYCIMFSTGSLQLKLKTHIFHSSGQSNKNIRKKSRGNHNCQLLEYNWRYTKLHSCSNSHYNQWSCRRCAMNLLLTSFLYFVACNKLILNKSLARDSFWRAPKYAGKGLIYNTFNYSHALNNVNFDSINFSHNSPILWSSNMLSAYTVDLYSNYSWFL